MPFPPEDKSFEGLVKDILIRLNLIERRLNRGTAAAGGGGGGDGLTAEQVRDIIGTALVAGANVTITVDDAGDHITIAATAGGGGVDAEAVRDLIGSTLVAGANMSVIVNDAGDTVTLISTDTAGLDAEAVRDLVGTTLVAGSNITITVNDAGDTITIASTAAGSPPVADYVKTTASLANAASETGTFTLGAAQVHIPLVLTVDKPSRVRFYATTAQRDADLSRAFGTLPLPDTDHGLLLEVEFTAVDLSVTIDRAVYLFEQTAFGAVPVTITNKSGSTGTVTVTLKGKGL